MCGFVWFGGRDCQESTVVFCTLGILNAACCLFYTSNVSMLKSALSITYTPFKKLLKCKLYEIVFSIPDMKSDYINHCTVLNRNLADVLLLYSTYFVSCLVRY